MWKLCGERLMKLVMNWNFFFATIIRQSFDTLIELVSSQLDNSPIDICSSSPHPSHISRGFFSNQAIVIMALKSMTSVSEPKAIYVQFSATERRFHYFLRMEIKKLIQVLSEDHRAKVYCNQLTESLKNSADRNSSFFENSWYCWNFTWNEVGNIYSWWCKKSE